MHGGASAQHEVITFLKPAPVAIAKNLGLDKLGGGVDPEPELRNPEQTLVITQAARATLDIRLLHEDGATVFDP